MADGESIRDLVDDQIGSTAEARRGHPERSEGPAFLSSPLPRALCRKDPVRLIEIESGHTIGEKRNFGCERAAGEFIAHWDDDDFSAPGRLADQFSRLQAAGKSVLRYSPMYFAQAPTAEHAVRWWMFQGSGISIIGSSLFFSKAWWSNHPFPAKQVGEDSDFGTAAARAGQLLTAEAGLLMAATIHPCNSSPRILSGYTRMPDFPGIPGLEFP